VLSCFVILACCVTSCSHSNVNIKRIVVLDAVSRGCTWLQEMFDSADVDRVGELDEFEVVRLMKKLNNSLATVKIQQKLKVLIPFCYLSRIILFFSYHLFDVTNWAFMC